MRKCILFFESGGDIIILTTNHFHFSNSCGIYQVQGLFHLVTSTQCFLFKAWARYCFSVRSRSLSRIEWTVQKTLIKVSGPPAIWRNVYITVLHSLSFVVSYMRRRSVTRTIKELSSEDGAESLLIAFRASSQYVLFIFSLMFLSLYVQFFSGSLKESPTLLLFCCLFELWRVYLFYILRAS